MTNIPQLRNLVFPSRAWISMRSLVWLLTLPIFLNVLLSASNSNLSAQEIDLQRIEASGLMVSRSKHLTLVTDIRDRADVREFNDVFEQAVGQWCEYFSIPLAAADEWHLVGCVMKDKAKFSAAGLYSNSLPPFPAGYQLGNNIWVLIQDGDYYTRHLLLHEGTHAFMEKFLGGYGAPWYSEGMAELMGVHQWKDGQLKINYDIEQRTEVPYWGRVKLIRKERDAAQSKSLDEVLTIPNVDFRQVKTYGWAWAACEFFDSHPDLKDNFRKLAGIANLPPHDFNQQVRALFKDQWNEAGFQWQLMVDEVEYGYDVAAAVGKIDGDKTQSGGTLFKLATNRGWQATGFKVQRGQTYSVDCEGRFLIRQGAETWPCEAGGISLEYYMGRPIGQLQAAVRLEPGMSLEIIDIGLESQIEMPRSGQLYLRINESAANLGDNEGQLKVSLQLLSD